MSRAAVVVDGGVGELLKCRWSFFSNGHFIVACKLLLLFPFCIYSTGETAMCIFQKEHLKNISDCERVTSGIIPK